MLPLVVTPSLLRGTLRGEIVVALRWWKDKNPPELEVKSNGRVRRVKLAKSGDVHEAVIDLKDMFSGFESLPADVLVECDKLRANCTLLPNDTPSFRRAVCQVGESWVVTNRWVESRVIADTNGAGIASLVERGRNVDHFSSPKDLIQRRFELSGHTDQLVFGWGDNRLADTSMSSSGARREGETTKLSFAGTLDKSKGLRTTVSYTAHGCTRPQSARDPRLSQFTWGGDASPKVYSARTLEVRITDCASSRRPLAELVVFTAAFVHWLGENTDEYRLSEAEYIDSLTSRWAAAKYGMQAART